MLPYILAILTTLAAASPSTPPVPKDIAGAWTGTLEHDGGSTAVSFDFAPDSAGRVMITYTLPALHFDHVTIARPMFAATGDSVALGPFRFAFDRSRGRLTGVMPAALFPAYDVTVTLARGASPAVPPRPAATSTAEPAWTFAGDSAMWAGPAYADGRVLVGTLAGTVVALDAVSGAALWRFRAGGAIRCRPTVDGGAVYVLADDAVLYRLDAASGALVWRAKVGATPVVRLPFRDPKSKFDRFGPDVTVAEGRLYVGTYDGRVVALVPTDGHVLWEFATGDAVLAATAVAGGRVYAGSYDHFVYALDATSGALLWKRDTRGRVVSTPALAGDRVVIGNRIYDLLGLDARTGAVAWTRYQWGTWVESSASVRDGIAYVGSSDGACVSAWDAASGTRRWLTDVLGWSWGQPAVTADRVYACSSGSVDYPVTNLGTVVALDRASGTVAWRYAPPAPTSGEWGFPGSVAVGPRFVYAGGLDGKVIALPR
jgi:outer membrane protein assembly factor BamB